MTSFKLLKLTHEWTLDNISYYLDDHPNAVSFESSKFASPLKHQEYFLKLYPNGINEESEQKISLYLCKCDSRSIDGDENVKIYCKLSLKNSTGEIFYFKEMRKQFSKGFQIGWDNFVDQVWLKPESKHVIDDKLTIVCQIEIYDSCSSKSKEKGSKIEIIDTDGTQQNKIDLNEDLIVKSWTKEISTLIPEFDHSWTIDNFVQLIKEAETHEEENEELNFPVLKSLKFCSPSNEQIKFRISVYPRGKSKTFQDHVSIYLIPVNPNEKIRVKCKIQIISLDGQECCSDGFIHLFPANANKGYGWVNFIECKKLLEEKHKFLHGDKLKIHCQISAIMNFKTTSGQVKQFESTVATLSHDLYNLFECDKFTDVVIRVRGKEFKAHKLILAARSPVFSAMFEHNLKEKLENCVEITDTQPEVFVELLKYIYSGKIFGDFSEELFILADKYELKELKKICEQLLCAKLTEDKVVDYLLLADAHNSRVLKTLCIDQINKNPAKFKETKSFKSLLKSKNVELLYDIYNDLSMTVLAKEN